MNTTTTTVHFSEYSGPVYLAGDYYDDVEQFLDIWYDECGEDAAPPDCVHTCKVTMLRLPDAEVLVESMTEDSYEGSYDEVISTPEFHALRDAINLFNLSHGVMEASYDSHTTIVFTPMLIEVDA